MGAISTRMYLIQQNALQEGLAFPTPPWWDVERLFEEQARWQIVLPDGREVLLLDWPYLLAFRLDTGRKVWNLPERQIEDPEIQQRRAVLLDVVQEAQWFIVAREQVWMAAEHTRPGCEVWRKPVWWCFGYREDEGYRAWLDRFWESHRIHERIFELPNPFWRDRVWLLTGAEAQAMDEHKRKAYLNDLKHYGRKLSAQHRWEMARFARALQQTEWVVLYDYEWESGLA